MSSVQTDVKTELDKQKPENEKKSQQSKWVTERGYSPLLAELIDKAETEKKYRTIVINELVQNPKATVKDVNDYLDYCIKKNSMQFSWKAEELYDGNSALHLAIKLKRFDLINVLINLSFELNVKRHCSRMDITVENDKYMDCLVTAIDELEERDVERVLDHLLNSKHPKIRDMLSGGSMSGRISCIELAIQKRMFKVVKLLLDCPLFSGTYHHPYHAAIDSGCLEIIPTLTNSKKTNINRKNKEDQTPLMFAVAKNDAASVKALLDVGAHLIKVNHQNPFGESALHLALKADSINKDIVRFLILAGADLDLNDVCAISPLNIAKGKNFDAFMLEVLRERHNVLVNQSASETKVE